MSKLGIQGARGAAKQEPPFGMDAVMAAGGMAGRLMSEVDWSRTPVGAMSSWPQSLRSAVSICLLSRFPICLWWGPDLLFVSFNDAYLPILGITKDPRRVMGQLGRDVWPEIWPTIGPMLDGVLTRGEATWSDDLLLVLNRNVEQEECYFTFSYSPILDEHGGVGGVFTAVTETSQHVIGERRLRTLSELGERTADAKSAEEACARAAETMARNPADVPAALIYLASEDGSIAHLVASSGRLDGIAVPRVVGTGAGDEAGSSLARVLATGETGHQVSLRPEGDGEVDWEAPQTGLVLPVAQPGHPRPAGLIVAGVSRRRALDDDYRRFFDLLARQVATAIADARAYEAERRRAEELAELDRAKTVFFSNVSHEFRTPLTLLLGPLEQTLARLPADQRLELEVAHRNALRLLRLVNTLLDFSRIEAGRIEASFEPVDLSKLTADLASAFRSAVEAAGLELVVDCPELPEAAFVDVEMWEKIVLNLLSNAFKFTFEGRITVRTRMAQGAFEVAVADTGVGIPETALPHLFDRFYRARETRSRTHEGTGIGLALVHQLVHLHGGSLGVESAVDAGTTFTVSIPGGSGHLPADRVGAARDRPTTAVDPASFVEEAMRWLPGGDERQVESTWSRDAGLDRWLSAGETKGARVLIVDDNADMRDYLRGLLEPHWAVEAVADGQTALEVARTTPPELVLTDVMMPGLDGFDLLDALRRDPATRHLPIVMLSARAGGEAIVEGLQSGADDYLIKPFAGRELVARVRANLELSRMRLLARSSQERYEEAERALERALNSLAAISGLIAEGGDVRRFYGRLSETVAQLVSCRSAVFWKLHGDEVRAEADAFGFDPGLLPRMRGQVRRGAGGTADRVVFAGEVFMARIDDSEPLSAHRDFLEALQVRDGIAVPWRAGDEPLGMLAVYDSLKPDGFTRDDVLVMRIAALAAGLVWQHKRVAGALAEIKERETSRLRAQAARAEELERVKSDFLKLASHELRGPLSVIRGYTSMIQDGTFGDPSPALASVLPILESKVGEMSMFINQMLEAARLEDHRLALNIERLDLRDVLRTAARTMQPLIPDTHRFHLALPNRPVPIDGDAARLGSVFCNMIDNAVRYSPGGGPVEVRCVLPAGARHAVVEVRDEGLGIAREDLPRLFIRFGRIVTPENSHIPGTGLGLHLAHELIRRHGGSITVTSEPKVGTRFVVTLRLALPPAREQTGSPTTAQAGDLRARPVHSSEP